VREAKLDGRLMAIIEPVLKVLETLNAELLVVEAMLAECCAKEPLIEQLTTAPGVGPIVASAFVSVIDEAERFQSAHQVQSYIGLVPSEDSSGGKRRIGAITKQGNPYLRSLLIQGGWSILDKAPDDDPLKLWGNAVAERRGRRIAVVAVARRLVGVLWAMWRDGTLYDPVALARQGNKGLQGAIRKIERNAETLEKAKNKSSMRMLKRKQPERAAK
jgi:transposase